MIGQYLPNNNKNSYSAILQNFLHLTSPETYVCFTQQGRTHLSDVYSTLKVLTSVKYWNVNHRNRSGAHGLALGSEVSEWVSELVAVGLGDVNEGTGPAGRRHPHPHHRHVSALSGRHTDMQRRNRFGACLDSAEFLFPSR
jgi:hypothetical protein